jgi:3-isopropylmalate/(R)-2-methylmalate dehydratase small subunit
MSRAVYSGPAISLGDSVNSDVLHPTVYFSLDPERVKAGLFQGLEPELARRVTPDTLLVAGRNFGCGSSREVVVQAMRLHGLRVVVASSFARIFYRNCINLGLLPVECPGANRSATGDRVLVDVAAGLFRNETQGWELRFPLVDPGILEKVRAAASGEAPRP